MKTVKATSRRLSLIAVLVLLLTTGGVALAQGGMITGTVALPEGGSAPAGTVVKLFEPGGWDVLGQANVAPDGTFSLGPVPNGLYVLKAVPPIGSGCTQSESISVSVLNAPVDVGTMVLTEPEIYGTVTAPDGLTPAPAEVWVLSGSGLPLQRLAAVFWWVGCPLVAMACGPRRSPMTPTGTPL
jgi:hypothetical protein